MFPTAPTYFALSLIVVVAVIANVGLSALWVVLGVTLAVTTVVAIVRSIPRKER